MKNNADVAFTISEEDLTRLKEITMNDYGSNNEIPCFQTSRYKIIATEKCFPRIISVSVQNLNSGKAFDEKKP